MTAALDLISWLGRATQPGNAAIRERYKLSTRTWNDSIRPDCNIESIYAFLLAWQATGDTTHLDKSRAIWAAISLVQEQNGSWKFSDKPDWGLMHWANDNSEVAIFLLRAAELDPVNAAAYRSAALATCDWLVSIQSANGGWRACENVPYIAPWSGAHACTALATAYPHASPAQQAAYLSAITSGLAYISARVGFDGRILLGYEVHGSEEAWRPPSSEQSICVRAFATCEKAFPTHSDAATWRTKRQTLHGWLDPLIDSSGAVRNGYGVGVTHADVAHITDHVYTTAFAVEAYRLSAEVDGNSSYASVAASILAFASGNIYYSQTDPDANGCLRGAYDLAAQDFNTSEVSQNGQEEGGGDMAYTGWSAAPVAALLFEMGVDAATASTGRRGAAVAFL